MTVSNMAKNTLASSCAGQRKTPACLLQVQYVTSIHGFKVGTLLDLGSNTYYVMNKFIQRYNLTGKDVNLEIEGIGRKKTYVSSKLYTVPVLIGGQMKDIKFYGLEVISATKASTKACYKALCERFKVNPEDVKRLSRLDLLILIWDNIIHPQKLRTVCTDDTV